MADPASVTVHGIAGSTLHADFETDHSVLVWIERDGPRASIRVSRNALREWALEVLRMTKTTVKTPSDEDVLAEWWRWDEKIKSATSWGAALAAADEFRKDAERELRRRGIPVPTR